MESLEGPDVRSRGVGKVGAGEEGDLAKQKEAGISCMESLRQPPYETRLNTDKCVNGFLSMKKQLWSHLVAWVWGIEYIK